MDIGFNLEGNNEMINKREIIKTYDQEGNQIELAVIRPGHRIMQDANMKYNLKVSELIRQASTGGERLLLRSEVENHLIKTGIWGKDDALKVEKLGIRIRASELVLQRGGIKLNEARQLAIEMAALRNEMVNLYNKRQQLDFATVESVAEQFKFGYLMTKCVVMPSDGKRFFSNYEDYMDKGDHLAVIEAAKCLAKFVYGLEDDLSMNLYENRWLKDHDFVDSQGRLLNRDGKLVDKEGRVIDRSGRFVDKDGKFVDKKGSRVDGFGNFVINDPKPFLDDDGNPIGQKAKSTKKIAKKKSRNKKVAQPVK